MLNAIMRDTTSDIAAMMTNWDRQESWKSGRVALATAAARKLAPTGPQVQNPNACARPIRGEKSRTSGAVPAMAIPSMTDSAMRASISCVGEWTAVMTRQQTVVSSMSGMSRRTRPRLSVSRPPRTEASAPATVASADTVP